jgi:hypothetical protein
VEVFLLRSGARLIEALGLMRGEPGLALGYALCDIALGYALRDISPDPEMPSSSWPVSEVLDVLASADPDIRCRTAGLRAALNGLLIRIDASEDGFWLEPLDPAASGIRSAA